MYDMALQGVLGYTPVDEICYYQEREGLRRGWKSTKHCTIRGVKGPMSGLSFVPDC